MDMDGADEFDGDDVEYFVCPNCGYQCDSSDEEWEEIIEEKEFDEQFDEGEDIRKSLLVDVNELGSADDLQTTEYVYGVDHGWKIKNIEILEEMCVCMSCRKKYADFYQMYEENPEDIAMPGERAMAEEPAKPEEHATPEDPAKHEEQAMPGKPAMAKDPAKHEEQAMPGKPAMAKDPAKPEEPAEPTKHTEQTSLDANVDLDQCRAPRNDLADGKLHADIPCC